MRTKRVLPLLAALALVGAAACTSDKDTSNDSAQTSSRAPAATRAAQAQTTASQSSRARAQTSASAAGDLQSPTEVVKSVRPSVVRIRAGGQAIGPFGVTPRAEGMGTGFIVDAQGYIVTNNHVVTMDSERAASRIDVDLWDGRTVQAKIVGRDPRTDLAVLKIDADNLTPLRFADGNTVEVGEEVLAIGFALDLGSTPTVTKGVVSAKDRVIEERQTSINGAIQTDAAINPGNSGGPLVNLRGEVVGVNTSGIYGAQGQPVQGIFFAISANVAEPIVKSLRDNGAVERGYLGVTLLSIDKQIAQAQRLNVEEGAGIQRVESGSPAEKAGLKPGDVIVKVGDQAVKNVGDVTIAMTKYRPGQKVTIEIARGGRSQTVEVTVGERPASAP
jgi:serine protease Do